jgi:hypothetical protein
MSDQVSPSPTRNRDKEKDALRKDCLSAQNSVIRQFWLSQRYKSLPWDQSMSSPLTCNLILCLGEFLYVHLGDGLNQAACRDFCALYTV